MKVCIKKSFFIIFFMSVILLSSCTYNNFVLPDDIEFLSTVEILETPEQICEYMNDNFTFESHSNINLNPYELWKTKKGDCVDLSTFATFIAQYHGYEVYQIGLYWDWVNKGHMIAVYKENNSYSLSSNFEYQSGYISIDDIISIWINSLKKYIIYDYQMNIIETNILKGEL